MHNELARFPYITSPRHRPKAPFFPLPAAGRFPVTMEKKCERSNQ